MKVKLRVAYLSQMLNSEGSFIVQTIHPIAGCGNKKYENSWRDGSWDGFSKDFQHPAPWYFRTVDTWKILFVKSGFNIKNIIEQLNPKTEKSASIIFVVSTQTSKQDKLQDMRLR